MSHNRLAHSKLTQAHIELGFDVVPGICGGLAKMFIQAALCEQKKEFNDRLDFIASLVSEDSRDQKKIREQKTPQITLKDLIEKAKNKLKNEAPSDPEVIAIAKEFIEIETYILRQAVYLEPEKFDKLFGGKSLHFLQIEEISQFVASDELKDRGGLKQIYHTVRRDPLDISQDYFTNLFNVIKKNQDTKITNGHNRIAMYLQSRNHGIALEYDFNDDQVLIVDANQLPPFKVPRDQVAQFVKKAFTFNEEDRGDSFNRFRIDVFTTGDNPTKIKDELESFKKLYPTSPYPTGMDASILDQKFFSIMSNIGDIQACNTILDIAQTLLEAKQTPEVIEKINLIKRPNRLGFSNIDQLMKSLVDKSFDVNKNLRNNSSLLIIAAAYDQEWAVDFLLVNKAKIDKSDKQGLSPLHHAAIHGSRRAALILLKNGANQNNIDFKGKTPLHYALERGDVEMISILIKHNADPNLGKPNLLHSLIKNPPKNQLLILQELKGVKLQLRENDKSPIRVAIENNNWVALAFMLNQLKQFEIADTDLKLLKRQSHYRQHLVEAAKEVLKASDKDQESKIQAIVSKEKALGELLQTPSSLKGIFRLKFFSRKYKGQPITDKVDQLVKDTEQAEKKELKT